MKVYGCNTEVILKNSNIPGIITGITIRNLSVTYEVSYFTKDEHKYIWINEYEFTTEIKRKKKEIGFK